MKLNTVLDELSMVFGNRLVAPEHTVLRAGVKLGLSHIPCPTVIHPAAYMGLFPLFLLAIPVGAMSMLEWN